MIRYTISPEDLEAAITSESPQWLADAVELTHALPDAPRSEDFKPHWSKIKQVFIELQQSKCGFCEKPLEGNIEQDVEHFWPKAEVKPWKVPTRLASEVDAERQPDDGSSEPGYARLAYSPFNYLMACKTCNSTLKKNFFPIEGVRDSATSQPPSVASEKPLLVYPIGESDADPETLIDFKGLSPRPRSKRGFKRRRALVTIEMFRLDDASRRRELFKLRATLVRLLFLELDALVHTASPEKLAKHQTAVEVLTSSASPFCSCLRSFKNLYEAHAQEAEAIADECLAFMKTKSATRRKA